MSEPRDSLLGGATAQQLAASDESLVSRAARVASQELTPEEALRRCGSDHDRRRILRTLSRADLLHALKQVHEVGARERQRFLGRTSQRAVLRDLRDLYEEHAAARERGEATTTTATTTTSPRLPPAAQLSVEQFPAEWPHNNPATAAKRSRYAELRSRVEAVTAEARAAKERYRQYADLQRHVDRLDINALVNNCPGGDTALGAALKESHTLIATIQRVMNESALRDEGARTRWEQLLREETVVMLEEEPEDGAGVDASMLAARAFAAESTRPSTMIEQ
eukprot:jgi/Chlat1/3966/Chrsp26S04213